MGGSDRRHDEEGLVKARYVHVWRMSDGRASQVLTLTDTAVVLAALIR